MSLYTLATPPSTVTSWRVRIQLDRAEYDFAWRYNTRAAYWTVDVTAAGGEALITGQVVKPGRDLLSTATSELRPPGVLVCLWGAVDKLAIPGQAAFENGEVYLAYVSRVS